MEFALKDFAILMTCIFTGCFVRLSVPSERPSAEDSGKDESVLQRCRAAGTERCDAP